MQLNSKTLIGGAVVLAALAALLVWWSQSPNEEPTAREPATERASRKVETKRPTASRIKEPKKTDPSGKERPTDLDPAMAAMRRTESKNITEVRDHRTGMSKGSRLEFKRDMGPRPISKANLLALRRRVRQEVRRCTEAHAEQAPRKTKAMLVFDLSAEAGSIQLERVQAEIKGGEYAEFEQCVQEAATGLNLSAVAGESQADFSTYQLAMGYRIR